MADGDVDMLRGPGYTDGQVSEIVADIADIHGPRQRDLAGAPGGTGPDQQAALSDLRMR